MVSPDLIPIGSFLLAVVVGALVNLRKHTLAANYRNGYVKSNNQAAAISPTSDVVTRIVKLESSQKLYERDVVDIQQINQRLLLIETQAMNDRQQFGRTLTDMQEKVGKMERTLDRIEMAVQGLVGPTVR